MAKEPDKLLLKMQDIVEWLGVDKRQIYKAVACGRLNPIVFAEGGDPFYKKEEVKALLGE